MVKLYTLPVPKQILNHLITTVRIQEIRVNTETKAVSVDVTLHISAAEENPQFTTMIELTGADYTAIGFNETQFISKTRAALNL